jgi:hypothetical protein
VAKAHPCIGGPLDGEFATSGDFHGSYEKVPGTQRNDYSKPVEGMYAHLSDDYYQFNTAYSYTMKRRNLARVVWLHVSMLRPSIAPSKR